MINTFLAAATTTAPTTAPVTGNLLGLVIFIIFVALVFDFLNGFHDAANAIATIVSTRVLSPTQAVLWAAMFDFGAAFLFGTSVAGTIGEKLVDPQAVNVYVVFGGLIGAITWNLITWWLALPTSSSHALVSGIAGAAVAKSGFQVILFKGWIPLLAFIVFSPVIGFILGTILMTAMAWIFRRQHPFKVESWFRRFQLVSSAVYCLGHGGNDAQKTMGIIVLLLSSAGLRHWAAPDPHSWANSFNLFSHQHTVAWWVILSCNGAIALGILFGGWRIVKTMGSGITRLQPIGGFCAETAAATTIISATKFGIPISTTHAITGAILGVGTTKGVRSVRWIWGQRIVTAWILTIPCAAFVGAITYLIVSLTLEPLLGVPLR
jgi:PiT family inorganic phosphate transporter